MIPPQVTVKNDPSEGVLPSLSTGFDPVDLSGSLLAFVTVAPSHAAANSPDTANVSS